MRTTIRKIGNSRGVLIPAALLAECGIADEIDLRLEGTKIVIERLQPARFGWYDGYRAEKDADAWEGMPPVAESDEWEW
jgi:antitoxin MazE